MPAEAPIMNEDRRQRLAELAVIQMRRAVEADAMLPELSPASCEAILATLEGQVTRAEKAEAEAGHLRDPATEPTAGEPFDGCTCDLPRVSTVHCLVHDDG